MHIEILYYSLMQYIPWIDGRITLQLHHSRIGLPHIIQIFLGGIKRGRLKTDEGFYRPFLYHHRFLCGGAGLQPAASALRAGAAGGQAGGRTVRLPHRLGRCASKATIWPSPRWAFARSSWWRCRIADRWRRPGADGHSARDHLRVGLFRDDSHHSGAV